jgi:ribosomal protein S18 acetylase RimI-like enzyme
MSEPALVRPDRMTGQALVVRPATAADAPAVKAILRQTFEATWRPHMSAAAAERYHVADRGGRYVEEKIESFIVAELDGPIVGMVHREGDFIEALHVLPKHQRMGIGRRLMERAEQEIERSGSPHVRLETDTFNEGSRSFYAALGYVEVGRYPDEEWNSGFTTVLLEKRLC